MLPADGNQSSPRTSYLDSFPLSVYLQHPPLTRTAGVDYAGPFLIKYGYVRKPTVLKAYVCLFVWLTVKAVHLELVSDLTAEAFLAAFCRFISRRGWCGAITALILLVTWRIFPYFLKTRSLRERYQSSDVPKRSSGYSSQRGPPILVASGSPTSRVLSPL